MSWSLELLITNDLDSFVSSHNALNSSEPKVDLDRVAREYEEYKKKLDGSQLLDLKQILRAYPEARGERRGSMFSTESQKSATLPRSSKKTLIKFNNTV